MHVSFGAFKLQMRKPCVNSTNVTPDLHQDPAAICSCLSEWSYSIVTEVKCNLNFREHVNNKLYHVKILFVFPVCIIT